MRNQTLKGPQAAHRSHKTYCDTDGIFHNILWEAVEFAAFAIFVGACIALISYSDLLDQIILGGF